MYEVESYERDVGLGQSTRRVGAFLSDLTSLDEARAAARRYAESFELHGENVEFGYWWGRGKTDRVTRIFAPKANFLAVLM